MDGAEVEARALAHSYIGTEHILLALLREPESRAARALASLGVTYEKVTAAVARMMGRGVEVDALPPAFTGKAQEAVDLAAREASGQGLERADTEHILLALVQDPRGAATRILVQLDAEPAMIRAALGRA